MCLLLTWTSNVLRNLWNKCACLMTLSSCTHPFYGFEITKNLSSSQFTILWIICTCKSLTMQFTWALFAVFYWLQFTLNSEYQCRSTVETQLPLRPKLMPLCKEMLANIRGAKMASLAWDLGWFKLDPFTRYSILDADLVKFVGILPDM